MKKGILTEEQRKLIIHALDHKPKGYDLAGLRQLIKIGQILENSTDEVTLEDADYDFILRNLSTITDWLGVNKEKIVSTFDALEKMSNEIK